MARNALGQQIEGHRVLADHWLGHLIDGLGQAIEHLVVGHVNLVVPGRVTLDHLIGKLEFAAAFIGMILETHGKCQQLVGATVLGQQGYQQTAVQPTRQ